MTVASFHLATFPLRRSPSRLLVVPAERWEVTAADGCILGKVMGTSAQGTTKLSADLRRWALFAAWNTPEDRAAFAADSTLMKRWRANAVDLRTFDLEPLSAHGSWDGTELFADHTEKRTDDAGPVAVLTRAAVRWRKIPRFTRSVPPVDAALQKQPGCSLAMGMGEWPVGEQATFSIWDSANAIRQYAYESKEHQDVIKKRADENWYREELFARFQFNES